jgi:hypothetical protein
MSERTERTYNLFRLRSASDFCCAVPNDCPVPAFIDESWTFAGTWHEGSARRPSMLADACGTRPWPQARPASRAMPAARARQAGAASIATYERMAAEDGIHQDCA